MKTSILISALILVAAGLFRWQGSQHLAEVRISHAKLVEEAAALGISLDPANPTSGVLLTKLGERASGADKEARAREVAQKMISFVREIEGLLESGEEPEGLEEQQLEYLKLMLSLDLDQFKILIAEFQDSPELNNENRMGIVAFAIIAMAEDYPAEAFASALSNQKLIGDSILPNLLQKWASYDFEAARKWIKEKAEEDPEFAMDHLKSALVQTAASENIALAFEIMEELEIDSSVFVFSSIGVKANTPEKRVEYLEQLRKHENKSDVRIGVRAIAEGVAKDGFEVSSQWLAERELSAEEVVGLAESLVTNSKPGEQGQWLDWMNENLAEDKRSAVISSSVLSWTQTDYAAAGEWLATVPEGEMRDASVVGYVQAIAHYEPETAAEWALTLPEGEKRQDTLEKVYLQWPTETPEQEEARQEFAEEYGFE